MNSSFQNFSTETSSTNFGLASFSNASNKLLTKAIEVLPENAIRLKVSSWILFVVAIIFSIVFS